MIDALSFSAASYIFYVYLKKVLLKIIGSAKIGSAKPVRSLIPDRFFETITTLFRTTK